MSTHTSVGSVLHYGDLYGPLETRAHLRRPCATLVAHDYLVEAGEFQTLHTVASLAQAACQPVGAESIRPRLSTRVAIRPGG